MGADPRRLPKLEQRSLSVLPTRTIYTFEGVGIGLTLTFLTPALPEDIDLLSRPVTYLTYEFQAIDGKAHDVSVYFDASAEITVNEPSQQVDWRRDEVPGLNVLRCWIQGSTVLAKKGDDLRIDWGYLYIAAPRPTIEASEIVAPKPGAGGICGKRHAARRPRVERTGKRRCDGRSYGLSRSKASRRSRSHAG